MTSVTPPASAHPLRAIRKVWQGFCSVFSGFRVTLYYLFHPREVVTEEYPDNRDTLKLHERYRGQIIMPHDEQGEHRCTACTICEKACPNGSISVQVTRNVANQRVLGQYIYRYGQCTLCGLCVEACPFDAIRFGQDVEVAVTDKGSLTRVLNRKEGRT